MMPSFPYTYLQIIIALAHIEAMCIVTCNIFLAKLMWKIKQCKAYLKDL